MARPQVERKIAAILAADVVGFSRLMEIDEVRTLAGLKLLRSEIIEPLVAEHRGRTVKLMGDGMLVEFASVVEAVSCAASIQKKLERTQADTPANQTIVLRIGVNLGDVIVDGDDLLGDGINVAARLEQLCEPGGVLISGTAYDQLPGKVKLRIVSAGEQRAKNIKRPIRTYKVVFARSPLEQPPRQKRPRRAVAAFLTVAVLVGGVALYIGWPPPGWDPQPAPLPGPESPLPQPEPEPVSEPRPAEPLPTPQPAPAEPPTTPSPAPAEPVPAPQPVPPEPAPTPAPQPLPQPEPAPAPQTTPQPVEPPPRTTPTPPPRGSKFAAIAVSADIPRKLGYSGEHSTRSEAKAEALRKCRAAGGEECTLGAEFRSCGAVASGNTGWGAGEGGARGAVEAQAIEACKEISRGCRIVSSQCVGAESQ